MIKGKMYDGLGQPILFLGLSGENVTRLVAGEPIKIDPKDLARLGLPPVTVVIHYGKTEEDILNEVAAHGVRLQAGA